MSRTDELVENLVKVIEEERVLCVVDIQYAQSHPPGHYFVPAPTAVWEAACEACIEAIRTRHQRREETEQAARAKLEGENRG
jgi:hypothetical protein